MATYEGGQKQATTFTQAEINRNKQLVNQVYRDAQKELERELAVWYSRFLTNQDPANGNFYNIMLQEGRLNEMLQNVTKIYREHSIAAGNITKESSKIAFTNQYYRSEYIKEWFGSEIGQNIAFSIVNPLLMETTVFSTEKIWEDLAQKTKDKIEATYGDINRYTPKEGTLTAKLISNRSDEIAALKRVLRRDLLLGKPYAETVKSVTKIIGTEKVKKGKRTLSGAKASAAKIVRTEGNRNLNAGNYSNTKYVSSTFGIEMVRQMLAVLDGVTRPQSRSMDGQTVGVDEQFIYPDGSTAYYPGNSGNPAYDANDRETVVDLMLDAEGNPIEPQLRRAKNPITGETEVFSFIHFDQWAAERGLRYSKSGKLVLK